MEQITIGQVAVTIAFIVALIGGITSLKKSIKEWISSALKERFDVIDKRFEKIEESQQDILEALKNVDMENTKSYLITYLSDIERGEIKNEIEKQRFLEEKKHYNDKGGNSYINHKTEELEKRGYL